MTVLLKSCIKDMGIRCPKQIQSRNKRNSRRGSVQTYVLFLLMPWVMKAEGT